MTIKNEISQKLSIPIQLQKLLYLGRTLSDEQCLAAYPNIKNGTKLNLIVMRRENLKDAIHRSFRRYYNEQQSERLTKEFMLDFERKIKCASLDDIERLANSILTNKN